MSDDRIETATLAGGCFWCLEAAYTQLAGIETVESGYSGGNRPNPTYEQVCSGATGHAEVIRIAYDPAIITYRDLLDVFFTIHDPTTLNRQGGDIGTQYRSVIFTHDDEQRRIAEDVIRELEKDGVWNDPIVTEVIAAPEFYPAEQYHSRYYELNPRQSYCQMVIAPKLAKLRARHFARLRVKDDVADQPVMEGSGTAGDGIAGPAAGGVPTGAALGAGRDPLGPGGIAD